MVEYQRLYESAKSCQQKQDHHPARIRHAKYCAFASQVKQTWGGRARHGDGMIIILWGRLSNNYDRSCLWLHLTLSCFLYKLSNNYDMSWLLERCHTSFSTCSLSNNHDRNWLPSFPLKGSRDTQLNNNHDRSWPGESQDIALDRH